VRTSAISARAWRLAALVVPQLLVILVVRGTAGMLRTASMAVVALSITMWGALVALALDGRKGRVPLAERLDVLTSTGAAMMWTGAGALVLAAAVGWASLAVVGVLGLGAVFLAVTWLVLVTGSDIAWKRAKIERSIVPAAACEGDLLRDELRISNLPIPPGTRLFVAGRALRHGPLSRFVVDNSHSHSEIELASELGPAPRGEHKVPALSLWFSDVFGLARTAVIRRGDCELVVLPQPIGVDHVRRMLAAGGSADTTTPATQLPTEGSFRMREYIDGDDTRRIHWVRSLQQNRLVVRLPDEVPPAEPAVRLILDTEMAGGDALACAAAAEMLDALVRVWLGIGCALADTGTRVILVAPIQSGDRMAAAERMLVARSSRDAALRFAARVTWQDAVPLASLLGERRGTRQIVVSCRPRRLPPEVRTPWVVVPDVAWTRSNPELIRPDRGLVLPYPSGAPDNRPIRRERARSDARGHWEDRSTFSQVTCWIDWTRFSGDLVARPHHGRAVLEVIP
jgi:uncharacterized protein (DUF58 family)